MTFSAVWGIFSNIEIHFAFSKLNYSENDLLEKLILIVQQTLEHARPTRRDVVKPQFLGSVTDLIVPDNAAPAPRPQSFLVEQSPNWTLPTHFHQEHQFQVFVAGNGTLGKKPIERLAVHYASPHSGYGPLISEADGIAYFTLRAVGDTGAWYLPEQREQLLLRVRKQQAHAAPASHVSREQLRSLAQPLQETLIDLGSGGLAAWLLRLPPNHSYPAPAHSEAGGGRFYVVTLGSLLSAGEELPALATVFASSEEVVELRAGQDGLEVLVLQFPAAAASSFIDTMLTGRA